MFWVAMETHPELNDKIELMVNYFFLIQIQFVFFSN